LNARGANNDPGMLIGKCSAKRPEQLIHSALRLGICGTSADHYAFSKWRDLQRNVARLSKQQAFMRAETLNISNRDIPFSIGKMC